MEKHVEKTSKEDLDDKMELKGKVELLLRAINEEREEGKEKDKKILAIEGEYNEMTRNYHKIKIIYDNKV